MDEKWELIRKDDNPKGSFSYAFKKIENNWLIICDYTTDEYYPQDRQSYYRISSLILNAKVGGFVQTKKMVLMKQLL